MVMTYAIGKNRYIYKDGRKVENITKRRYVSEYLKFLGFSETTIDKATFTKKVLSAQYLVLYQQKDIEIDEDILFKSLREIKRVQI